MPIRILIVEDEAISAMALSYTLERLGCSVVDSVDSGEAAIEAAKRHKPDLVFMDIQLRTKMNGIEAANAIWQQLNIRSVFVTAYDDSELEKTYRGAQPYTLLVKPVLEEDIAQFLKQ